MSLLPSTSLQTHIHFNQSLERLSKRGRGGYWISGVIFPTVSLSTFLGWCSAIFSWLVVFYFRPVRMVCEKGTIKYHTWISYLRLRKRTTKTNIWVNLLYLMKFSNWSIYSTPWFAPNMPRFFPRELHTLGLESCISYSWLWISISNFIPQL